MYYLDCPILFIFYLINSLGVGVTFFLQAADPKEEWGGGRLGLAQTKRNLTNPSTACVYKHIPCLFHTQAQQKGGKKQPSTLRHDKVQLR